MEIFLKLLWVSLGAMFGASSRFLVGEWAKRIFGVGFPFGTMIVNLLGSLIMGFLFVLAREQLLTNDHAKLFLMVGFLGSFTTFSSFSLDNANLINASMNYSMLLNLGLQNVLGILLVFSGMWLARFVI